LKYYSEILGQADLFLKILIVSAKFGKHVLVRAWVCSMDEEGRKALYNNTKAGMGTHPQEVKGK